MIKFNIVINCGPCEAFIGQCIASVREQSFSRWEAYVTVDPCGDETYARAILAAGGDPRVRVMQNETRRYSMSNLVHAIQLSQAEPEDVIVSLDGDDWFATADALRIIEDAYERFDCWLTYGSWLSNVKGPTGQFNGLWPAYPEATTDFRRTPFLGTAVRTWKKWLWDHIQDSDLRNDSDEYVRVSEDQMIMHPLLEMCGTAKARHIAAPIMVYNKMAKYSVDDALTEEGVRNGYLIESRRPYPRLETKVYRGKSAVAVSGSTEQNV